MEVFESMDFERHICNPLFWQALGRALGWKVEKDLVGYEPHGKGLHSDTFGGAGDDDSCYCDKPKIWKDKAHQYLDAHFNATEEQFWKELIKK